MELPAHGAALCAARDAGRRRRCLPDRLGACGLTTLRSSAERLSVRGGAAGACRRCARDVGATHEDLLCGGLDRIFRPPAGRRQRRRATSISIRSGRRERSISSASTIISRSPTGATSRAMPTRRAGARPTISPISARISAAGRVSTGTMRAPEDRAAQKRTPITDGAYGKAVGVPLQGYRGLVVERALRPAGRRRRRRSPTGVGAAIEADLVHRARLPGGRQGRQPAERVLRSEIGAVGAALFFQRRARRSARSAPTSTRIQRFFDVDHPEFDGSNPVSPIYGGPMVDPAHLHLWAWDARPYPYFPECTDVWSDGANWERGHWLNGRLGSVTLVRADRRGDARPRFRGLCGRRRARRGRRLCRQRGAVGARHAGAGAAGVPHRRGGCRRPRALPRAARGRAT